MSSTPGGYHLTATQVCLAREFVRCPNKWQYGYDLAKRTKIAGGTLYPLVRRMWRRGWLELHPSDSSQSGPPRVFYRPTPAGIKVLIDMVARWDARYER